MSKKSNVDQMIDDLQNEFNETKEEGEELIQEMRRSTRKR